jgi:hypothetical protein
MTRPTRHRRRFAQLVAVAAVVLAACAPIPSQNKSVPVRTYYGNTFDACAAPSTFAMGRWRRSFGGVGVYIGGANRACGQPNLTPAWVRTVKAQKWHVLPLYIGLQAPCISRPDVARINPAAASQQGAAAAGDAVRIAKYLGLSIRSPIYYDMEHYGRDPACILAVRKFVSAWVTRLHAYGYYGGLYSSSSSGIADQDTMYDFRGLRHADVIWFANWNGQRNIYNDRWIKNTHWSGHRRHHQYQGGHNETHNGVTINIDRTISDGWVAT